MPAPKRQPAFPFYPDAWFGSIAVEMMPPEVEGTYIRLLGRQWCATTLPLDPKAMRLLTKLTPQQWAKAWPHLEPLFPVTADQSGRRNETLHAVKCARDAFVEEQAEKGRNGGKAKAARQQKGKKQHAGSSGYDSATALPEDSGSIGYDSATDLLEQHGSNGHDAATDLLQPKRSFEFGFGTDTPNPPPSGGGQIPAAPRRSEHRDAVLEARSQAFDDSLNEAVAEIPHDAARLAVRRLLDEQRMPTDRWSSWVRRVVGWTAGLSTTGMRHVSYDAIADGLLELLDANPVGQAITPQAALIFAEKAEKRRSSSTVSADRGGRPTRETHAAAIQFARDGDEDAIAHCRKHGIDFSREIA